MATSPTSNKEAPGELSDIKRKLAWRMGIAGLMIVGLLGGLALFDHFSSPSVTEPSEPQFTEPVPVAKKVLTQPVTPAEPAAETSKEEKKASAPESSAAPVDKSAPTLTEPPPRPEVAAKPAVRAPSTPATPAVPAKPAEPKPAPVPATPVRAEAPVVAEPSPPQPALPRLFSGYALQAGVFSDPRRAEELHAKLTLEGIPSSIEARVEVGPFKTRAEADAAREKLKTLGVDTVLLLPKGAKR